MFKNVKWLFFDVGSTIMNEQAAYEHRMRDIADLAYRAGTGKGGSCGKQFVRALRYFIAACRRRRPGDCGSIWNRNRRYITHENV